MKITEMTACQAKNFFLKGENYCNFSLPIYFEFEPLLTQISEKLSTSSTDYFNSIGYSKACDSQNVNYILQTNKHNNYSWRPLELIHPAIYTYLVHQITKNQNWNDIISRFCDFQKNEKIICTSLPKANDETSSRADSITSWWQDFEQKSINNALSFRYLFTTDIADFYPSIYTHSIDWAVHTKEHAKEDKHNKNRLGQRIDYALRQMNWGQTNGIPQGSVLMDFIAEILLGYSDEKLSQVLKNENITDYQILRYRDDYKIFTRTKEDAESIARHLTTVLRDFGLQLNHSKTFLSEDIILSSIKKDKQDALMLFGNSINTSTIQKTLLKLLIFSHKHKNSSQLDKYLFKLYKRIEQTEEPNEEIEPIVSIITELMYYNPRTFSYCSLILSNLFKCIKESDKKLELIDKIRKKFEQRLGTSILDLWLQRISHNIQENQLAYKDKLCQLVSDPNRISHNDIWNSEWITDNNFKEKIMATSFINRKELAECNFVITEKEVAIFSYN